MEATQKNNNPKNNENVTIQNQGEVKHFYLEVAMNGKNMRID